VEETAAGEELRVRIAVRYLGDDLGPAYIESTKGGDSVLVRLTPEHWRSNDYGRATR